jgi:hypothetical protein
MWFSTLVPANKRTAVEIMAGLSAQTAPWHSDLEFRTAVSFSHELVHYYQDMLTGVGHWDHLQFRNFFSESFMWATQLLKTASKLPFSKQDPAYKSEPYYQYCYDKYSQLANDYTKNLLYAKAAFIDQNSRRKEITDYVKVAFKDEVKLEDSSEEFLSESIFESEAVSTVYETFVGLAMSDNQLDIIEKNDVLVMPHKMSGIYTTTLSFLMSFLREGLSNLENVVFVKTVLFFMRFLSDLSAAYPPVRMIEKSGLHRLEFEPGVKFLNLVLAIHKMNKPASEIFLDAYRNKDAYLAEQVLLDNCRVRYPHSREIYAGWIDEFEGILQKEDDILIQLRLNACRSRVKNSSSSFFEKNLSQLIFHNLDIPINFLTSPEGITSYWMNQQAISKEFQEDLLADLLKWNTSMELFELFFRSGRFTCPFAEANIFCDIAKKECFHIRSLDEIPTSKECLVRTIASPFLKKQ